MDKLEDFFSTTDTFLVEKIKKNITIYPWIQRQRMAKNHLLPLFFLGKQRIVEEWSDAYFPSWYTRSSLFALQKLSRATEEDVLFSLFILPKILTNSMQLITGDILTFEKQDLYFSPGKIIIGINMRRYTISQQFPTITVNVG